MTSRVRDVGRGEGGRSAPVSMPQARPPHHSTACPSPPCEPSSPSALCLGFVIAPPRPSTPTPPPPPLPPSRAAAAAAPVLWFGAPPRRRRVMSKATASIPRYHGRCDLSSDGGAAADGPEQGREPGGRCPDRR